MNYFEQGFNEECLDRGIDPIEFVKSAELSEEEFKKLRHLTGLTTESPGLYKEYKKERKVAKILASLYLALKGGTYGFLKSKNGKGIQGGLAGAGIGGLAGYGLTSLGLKVMDRFDRNRIKRLEKGEAPSLLTTIMT